MNITIEIPDGKYCNDGKQSCLLWKYGGSGSFSPPFCKRFMRHPESERHKFPFESSIKLSECRRMIECS
ncbi:hypothetical protein LCGC14_1104880 [marine sediment metagenome]|uniref:Uncharacterized protein n=1 Tax=marine sediment metagenome TaxID=412755 RepID=A0A0F9MD48_9ZZZZ